MYSIVDIETTGSNPTDDGITEIGVCVHDGEKIVKEYSTLINPGKKIPRFIVGLTGITDKMVEDAPSFEEVAGEIFDLLKDEVFIAHNVGFDYNFLKEAFRRTGRNLNRKRLCTVRLSRSAFPGLPSYSLGKLCNQLGIDAPDRHRAFGDAKATTILFDKILKTEGSVIENALKSASKEGRLPPNLPKERFLRVPQTTGIYYFKDEKGKIIYVGKAKNIRTRFLNHFNGNSKIKIAMQRDTHDIDYVETGNELTAFLLESNEIKKHWPKYNFAQKRPFNAWGLYKYKDNQNVTRLFIDKSNKHKRPIFLFNTYSDGRNFLWSITKDYGLCPKKNWLQSQKTDCNKSVKTGSCYCVGDMTKGAYQKSITQTLKSITGDLASFIIFGKGKTPHEKSVIIVKDGKYMGFGFVENKIHYKRINSYLKCIKKYRNTTEAQAIIRNYLYFNEPDEFLGNVPIYFNKK